MKHIRIRLQVSGIEYWVLGIGYWCQHSEDRKPMPTCDKLRKLIESSLFRAKVTTFRGENNRSRTTDIFGRIL